MSEPRQATLAECNKQLVDSMKNERKIIVMIGPAGRISVPKADETFYRQKGYSVVVESVSNEKEADTSSQTQSQTDPNADNGDGGEDGAGGNNDNESSTVDYSQFDDEQLKTFAKKAGIKNAHTMKTETIISRLQEAGFDPNADNGDGGEE